MSSNAEINLEIERNLHDLYREAAKCAALPLEENESLSYVLSRPSRWPETLFRARFGPEDAARSVGQTAERAKRGELPSAWKVGPHSSPDWLGELLASNGYVIAFENTNMALELSKLADRPAPLAGFETSGVDSDETLQDWLGVVARGLWQWDESELPHLRTVFVPLLAAGRFTAFISRCEGAPAAAAAIFRTDGVAGLYHVATVPELRGRGLGREVVSAALHHARAIGCKRVILHASQMGEPLYRKLGFLPFGRLSTYRLGEQ